MNLTDEELVLLMRALSIHGTSLRRKYDRVTTSKDKAETINEISAVHDLLEKLTTEDMRRLGAA